MVLFQTQRLIIREAAVGDGPFLHQLYNSPSWIQFIGDRGLNDFDKAEAYIQDTLVKSYRKNGFGFYIIEQLEDAALVGVCGIIKRNYLDHPDVGFGILAEFEGKGLAFEASKAMMDHALQKLNFPVLQAITTAENVRSRNLLARLGMTFKKTTIDPDDGEELMVFEKGLSLAKIKD